MPTAEQLNDWGAAGLPGHLGIVVTEVASGAARCEMPVLPRTMAPNGYLHAASIVVLADTAAGFGCAASLPPDATGFTTIELKANYLGTAQAGTLECHASAVHLGRTTQVWDAVVRDSASGRTLALFRCTQLLLYSGDGG